ncbi:MAG: GNAT family N-acetyltransferase [Erysipelotrichaceae bacterium]|jgi:RimJ/RimL family protein N-acetyltransferase|nr:GNAT family N-acetyltransferase [Bacillota bacterium]
MNVDIKPITLDDTDNIVKWRNTSFVLNNFIDQNPITKESHIGYFKSRIETGKVKQFIIVCDDNDIGTIFLRDVDFEKKSAEYGIFIGEKDYLGKGIAIISSKKILDYAFNDLKLEKVFLRVLERNANAIKSYKNIGFVLDEYFETVKINDVDEKVVFMSITKEMFLL